MATPRQLSEPFLKVASAAFTDFGVVWLIAALATNNRLILLRDIIVGIVSLGFAYKAEQLLKQWYGITR